jgi:hypothetical protein
MPTGSFEGLLEPYAHLAVFSVQVDVLEAMHDQHKRDIAATAERIDRTLKDLGQ